MTKIVILIMALFVAKATNATENELPKLTVVNTNELTEVSLDDDPKPQVDPQNHYGNLKNIPAKQKTADITECDSCCSIQ